MRLRRAIPRSICGSRYLPSRADASCRKAMPQDHSAGGRNWARRYANFIGVAPLASTVMSSFGVPDGVAMITHRLPLRTAHRRRQERQGGRRLRVDADCKAQRRSLAVYPRWLSALLDLSEWKATDVVAGCGVAVRPRSWQRPRYVGYGCAEGPGRHVRDHVAAKIATDGLVTHRRAPALGMGLGCDAKANHEHANAKATQGRRAHSPFRRGHSRCELRLSARLHRPPGATTSFIAGICGPVACAIEDVRNLAGADRRPVSYTHLRAHETRHDLVCR